MIRVAILTTDNREHHRRYDLPEPYFGPAIVALLQGLAARSNLEIHVVSCTQRPMHAPAKLGDNIWFHLLDVPKMGWLKTFYQGCIRAVRRKVHELQPHLVHGQGTERDCAMSAVFSGFPNVTTIHGNMRSIASITGAGPFSYNWCAARLEQITLPRTGGVLCNSAFTQSQVKTLARRTWLVPNALRSEFFDTPLPHARRAVPILLNIGTISRHKRQLELLKIAEALHRDDHVFELQFMGDAPRDGYTEAFFSQLKLGEQHGFARYVEPKGLSELLRAIDCASALVHISSAESFGLVVAEALARNLKLFATNTGGIPDIAAGVEGAELFELDQGQDLAQAIGLWLRRGCPRPTSAAAEMRNRYHPGVIATRHAQIYGQILEGG